MTARRTRTTPRPGRRIPGTHLTSRIPGSHLAGRARLRADSGSALIEFVVLAAVMLIPAMYLIVTLGAVQSAVFAADGLARDIARIHATHAPGQAQQRQEQLIGLTQHSYGLSTTPRVDVRCSSDPCATPGGTIDATVSIPVPIPGLGPLGGPEGPVEISSHHTVAVDQHWDGRTREQADSSDTSGAREDEDRS